MRYSCFDERVGAYRVFEDDAHFPVNGDLPHPRLPSDVNGIGVPASDAGRPLPPGVREIGTSSVATGIIVNCSRPAFAGVGDELVDSSRWVRLAVGAAALLAGLYMVHRITK